MRASCSRTRALFTVHHLATRTPLAVAPMEEATEDAAVAEAWAWVFRSWVDWPAVCCLVERWAMLETLVATAVGLVVMEVDLVVMEEETLAAAVILAVDSEQPLRVSYIIHESGVNCIIVNAGS